MFLNTLKYKLDYFFDFKILSNIEVVNTSTQTFIYILKSLYLVMCDVLHILIYVGCKLYYTKHNYMK